MLSSEGEALHDLHQPAVSRATTEAMPMIAGTIEKFKAMVMLANRVAWAFNDGALDTCILAVSTRYALAPQNGFVWQLDARPSHWRPLAKEITRWLEQTQLCPKRIGEILRSNPQPCEWIEQGP